MRQQVSSALDAIIHTARLPDGTRKVTSVSEIAGMEGDTIMLQDIFTFQREGVEADGTVHGRFVATGIRPRFAERLKSSSHGIDAQVFDFLG
jgi:pilus assembly protein CpaF